MPEDALAHGMNSTTRFMPDTPLHMYFSRHFYYNYRKNRKKYLPNFLRPSNAVSETMTMHGIMP